MKTISTSTFMACLFARNPIAEDLIVRVDQARRNCP